jgi:hypothetical protein
VSGRAARWNGWLAETTTEERREDALGRSGEPRGDLHGANDDEDESRVGDMQGERIVPRFHLRRTGC